MTACEKIPHQGDSGFALLLVFAMAAILAVMLYSEMPRVVFEAQRNKEQLLIDRGEQYQRAIQVYFRTLNHYPTSIEQLEDTNHKRFLRRRYKDPMTGKEEWRLIHMGPGGFPTDSLTIKPPPVKKDGDKASDAASGAKSASDAPPGSTPAATDASGQPVPNYAQRRGASDRGPMGTLQPAPGAQPGGDQGEQPPPENEQFAGNAEQPPPESGEQPAPAGPGAAVVSPGQPPQPGQPEQPGQPQQPGQPGQPQQQPGMQVQPGAPQPGFGAVGMVQQQVSPDQTQNRLQPGFGSMGQQLRGVQNPADTGAAGQGASSDAGIQIINSQLRGQTRVNFPGNASAIGAGIAGVASKAEAEGIKTYNKHTKYNEWEFIYDPRKDPASPWGRGAIPGTGGGAVGFGSTADTGKVGKTQ